MKITHPVTRAAFGVAALVAVAILSNWLVSFSTVEEHFVSWVRSATDWIRPFRESGRLTNAGLDFTEKKIHTLSDGTRAILGELKAPVEIRYYATRNTDYLPEEIKLHMRRVDDLLKEYVLVSKGKLRVKNLDPQPDTDAEDNANLDGIEGQRGEDQNLYFGLAISCREKTTRIPFINPRDETMLEYQMSKAIADVTTTSKPKIGVMSALNLKGSRAMMPGQQSAPPWVIYQQLEQTFDLVDIPMASPVIDPKTIKVLLLFHPAGITPEAEFAVDQYVLGGGTVVACLDAFSKVAEMTGGGNPMMGQQGIPTSSTLPTLLPAWGVSFESTKVLADPSLATQTCITVLTLAKGQMPQDDNVITKDLSSCTFYLTGAFTKTGGKGLEMNTLVKSTNNAGFVDAMRASRFDPTLPTTFHSAGSSYDLVTHLKGVFKTAFPDGKPKAKNESADGKKDEPKDEPKGSYLKEGSSQGNVFLIGDVDAFYDEVAYNVQPIGGTRLVSPKNGNSSLFFNIMDQAVGSKHLIGSRSRAAIRRPFTVVQKMEADFNEERGSKIEAFQEKQRKTQEEINRLQEKKSRGSELYLSPEQETELKKLHEKKVECAKAIREQQKELRRQKDDLAGRITILNVAFMPLTVIIIGLQLLLVRRTGQNRVFGTKSMSIRQALFSFEGRLGRADYWFKGNIVILLIWAASAVLYYGIAARWGVGLWCFALAYFINIATLVPMLALMVKRLHDRGRSAWFILINLIPVVGQIWLIWDVWASKGTAGPNRFGDDPLQDQPSETITA